MVRFSPRTVRNFAFALLVGTVIVLTQTNTRAVSYDCQTWCSRGQGCDAEWCGDAESTCYALGGFLCQGCYEDAACNTSAIQCDIPN
jgi:hypothetical protein